MKPFSSLIGISLLIFIGWIAVGGQPTERIERFCRPVSWTGNIVSSLFQLGAPGIVPYISNGFTNTEYGCRYTSWRVLYEKDWVVAQQEIQQQQQEEMMREQIAAQKALDAKQSKSKDSQKKGVPQK